MSTSSKLNLGTVILIILLACMLLVVVDDGVSGTIEIYIINSNKELIYYIRGNERDLQLHADENLGYVYVISTRRKKCTEELFKTTINDNVIIVRKPSTIEII